ncbi:unnamed protein product [Cuscuta campestris]|uniref:Replication factor A C-terminal domain-containing protein n=1 Tax=Cuscuta campestris TaxID=132261 RepID=A0A484KXN1_9ASTE|nr:unnamed protein product [Cuscuta campestris]
MRAWSYLGCSECNRKVYPEDSRYKVIVRVVDQSGGGHATFVIFDKECTELLGVSPYLLREAMIERKLDPDTLPQELDGILSQKALFKVHVRKNQLSPSKKGGRIFSVGQIVTDPRVVGKYKEEMQRTEVDELWDMVEDLSQIMEKVLNVLYVAEL